MFDFIKTLNLFNNDKDTEMDVDFKLKNKNGDNKLEHVNIAKKQIINNFGEISDLETLENLKELDVSHETKVKLINLKDALVQGKNRYALSEYLKMRNDVKFQNLPNKFQFKVLIGILNSKVNLNYDDEEIQNSINDIRALGDNYEGIHRFYYLQAIIKYKKRDFNSALNFINKSLEISSDYFKSKALKIVLECLLNKAGIKEAETEVNSLIKKQEIKTEEKEALLGALGDVFYNAQDYKNARKYYIKSNKYKNTLSKDIAIGTCLYYESFLVDSYSEELVPLEKIDFMVMDKSKSKFEEVISKINVDNVELISKLMFPYYFGILILHGEHDKLIEIYNKYKKELKLTNESVIGFIVEAQIKNNQLDIELLEKLSSRLYFSYKSLHHEMNSEFTKAIEILEQGIAEYPEDKQLRFGLLNSLRNTSNDDKYLHYYKKFNPNENDDALLMNYIIYLDENNKNDEFRKKREILLNKTENPMVLSHLFEMFLSKNDVDFLYKIYHKIKRNKEKFAIKNFDKIQYQLMMYFLERELHTKYLNEYANISFKYLENREKVLIDLNYLIITGEFEKASKKYYELFRITEDYELLLRLVELLFKSNQYYEIEFYLELIQPMELKVPEMFYIYYARYYELIEEVDKGIEKLDEIKEFALKNKKSIFHKFYFGYCLRNNKFGKAFNYYSEYEKINPEVDWLHKIQVSEDGDINELISQIDKISGGRANFKKMDKMLNKSLIGVSLYSIITNRDIELMFTSSDYPFSKLNISVSGSNEDLSKYQIEDSLVIDADTLYLLYRIDIFDILEEFDNIYIPYQTFEKMRNNYGLYQNKYTKELIDLLEKDVRFKSIPVTVANEQYEKYIKLYDENISQCLLISDSEEIPFLSSEISLKRYFANKKVIDINNLICHLRSLKCDDEKISDWIYKLRKNNFEFISFKSIDIYNSYFRYDEVGLELYLKMTKISNYLSFVEVYIWFLVIIGQEVEVYNFKELSGKFINYIDKYTGKTRYYISEIRRVNSIEAHEYSYQIENKIAQIFNDFNVKRIYELIIILNESERFNRNILTKKIKEIISAYIHFLNRFVKMSLILDYTESKLLNLIYKNTELNNNKIIDYFIDI